MKLDWLLAMSTVFVMALASIGTAQETKKPAGEAAEKATAEAMTSNEGDTQQSGDSGEEAVVQNDGGIETIHQAEATPGPQFVANVTAEDQLKNYMKTKGWVEGWDKEKKRYLVVQAASFNTEDPSYDRDFFDKRESFSLAATLMAKSDILRFINETMTAVDQMQCPGTDVYKTLNREYEEAQAKLNKQKEHVAQLLKDYDQTQSEALSGATTPDRINALMDAAIREA